MAFERPFVLANIETRIARGRDIGADFSIFSGSGVKRVKLAVPPDRTPGKRRNFFQLIQILMTLLSGMSLRLTSRLASAAEVTPGMPSR
jgi:hypothetical protein